MARVSNELHVFFCFSGLDQCFSQYLSWYPLESLADKHLSHSKANIDMSGRTEENEGVTPW